MKVRHIDLDAGESVLVETGDNQFLIVRAVAPGTGPTTAMPKIRRRSRARDKETDPPPPPGAPKVPDVGLLSPHVPWVPKPPDKMAEILPPDVLSMLSFDPPEITTGETIDVTGYVRLENFGARGD